MSKTWIVVVSERQPECQSEKSQFDMNGKGSSGSQSDMKGRAYMIDRKRASD